MKYSLLISLFLSIFAVSTSIVHADTISITFSSGNKYSGEVKNGEPNGKGTYTHVGSGDVYVGEFKNSEVHGYGTYTHANGDFYVGEFKNGKKHGYGTDTYNGDVYVGEFKNGEMYGEGIYTSASGDKYQLKDGDIVKKIN